jgi:CO dehydrogenase/acetyl-CoA synthase gamma subunit (corrinoid Fe-S protein)
VHELILLTQLKSKNIPHLLRNFVHKNSQMDLIAPSVKRLSTGWTVRESNPGGGEIFHTHP